MRVNLPPCHLTHGRRAPEVSGLPLKFHPECFACVLKTVSAKFRLLPSVNRNLHPAIPTLSPYRILNLWAVSSRTHSQEKARIPSSGPWFQKAHTFRSVWPDRRP